MWERPTLKNLFEKEEIVVVKREYRRRYKLNWATLLSNILKLIQFWKPANKRFLIPAIEKNINTDEVAHIKDVVIERVVNDERV